MTTMRWMLASLAVAVGPAEAQEALPRPEGEKPASVVPTGPDPVYPASFYDAFQPQTALDMLERTPGFLLSEGSAVRGFGGAAGNVLIDGQRPTVKAGGITEVLRRIGARQVDRIVLLRGSEAAEAQGQTLVANVIRKADAAGSGNAVLELARTEDGRISPTARISHARRIGAWQASLELSAVHERYVTDANYLTRGADGALQESRAEAIRAKAPEYGLTASGSRPFAGGTLTLNLRLNHDEYSSRRRIAIREQSTEGAPDAERLIDYTETSTSAEFGADWTRPLGNDWSTKLVGLARGERASQDEDYRQDGFRSLSQQDQKPLELVARSTVSREGDHALRPEFGGELAYNRLGSRLAYGEDDGLGGGMVPVDLTNADTRVTELRGEGFANANLRLAGKLDAEVGLAVEFSRIRVTGDSQQSQSLSYLKPSGALVWSPGKSTQVRLGWRRTVDQLDFSDFAASVDQADGRPLGGNARLRPARISRALLRLDHRWGQGGAIAVEAFHQRHQGMLGYILLPSGDQALGTVGNAVQWGATAQASLPLTALLPGARLTLDGTLRKTSLRDPITGRNRRIDDMAPRSFTGEFRHDLPRLRTSWGVSYTLSERYDIYYVDEHLTERSGDEWSAYVETTALAGVKITLKASAGIDSTRLRSFYRPSRANPLTGTDARTMRDGSTVTLVLSRAI
ncbi:TonB-dependent siderophore receptor [Novosphingobium sp. TCA1]|uniref:TonB-dependent receptor plug domain-containing protein n=1 Tax=Novosphingobium sp. TCA1 TaxID=2682474 RepID=UPI00135C86C5|nr:TonB-dependent receptor [Novosphingobium sp. TCA1]